IDFRLVAPAAPDHVGLQADQRIAPARASAFDRFQQERIGPPIRQLQQRGDRRLEVRDQPGPDDLGLAGFIRGGKAVELRLDIHWSAAIIWSMTSLLRSMVTFCPSATRNSA